jgi:RNA polymerase sigma-70 factor (ECF subfamily)
MSSEPFRPGNRDDFDRLYRQTYARIRFTLQAMLRDAEEAEDCAQEAFVRAFRAWARWKPDAPAEAWMHRIAINTAISHRRRERMRTLLESVIHPRSHEAARAGRAELIDALRRLRPQHAAVVVLRHYHGYSNREIAAALGIPESTVSSQLIVAKRQLAAILGEPVADRLEPGLPGSAVR